MAILFISIFKKESRLCLKRDGMVFGLLSYVRLQNATSRFALACKVKIVVKVCVLNFHFVASLSLSIAKLHLFYKLQKHFDVFLAFVAILLALWISCSYFFV